MRMFSLPKFIMVMVVFTGMTGAVQIFARSVNFAKPPSLREC